MDHLYHGMSSLLIAKHRYFLFRDIHSHLRITESSSQPAAAVAAKSTREHGHFAYPGVMGMSIMIVIVIILWWTMILWWIILCYWDRDDDNHTMMDNSNAKNVMDILGVGFILSYLGRTGFKYPMSNQSIQAFCGNMLVCGISWDMLRSSIDKHGIFSGG